MPALPSPARCVEAPANPAAAGPLAACFRVTVAPHGWVFDAAPSLSLLAAARAAGVVLPSSCRNGTCRACMCRLAHGRARYLIEWPGLSADEHAAGYLLPCVATPLSDLTLDAPKALALRAGAAGG